MKNDESYLDRLITFIFEHVNIEPIDECMGELVFRDVYTCFNRARDWRERGENAYIARCGTLLRILPKIREHLRGDTLSDSKALEEVLINIAAQRPAAAPPDPTLPPSPRRRRRRRE